MWLFSLKLSRNASVTPHSAGHQRSYTVHMGISKVYKGSPFPMLLFAPHRLLFNRNYIFATCPIYMVFLKLFLRLPVVLSSSPLKILEGFCCGIHSNCIHVIRNVLICFIEEGLFCLYNGSNTDKIWNYIFQRGQSSMVAIGPVRLCLVKIYIYEKTTFWLKMIWHKIGPSKNCHISPSYTTGHGVSNDAKYSVVYSSQLSMMGTRSWCVTS